MKKEKILVFFIFLFFLIAFVSANTYLSDVYFTVPDTLYTTNESIEFKGYIYQNNSDGNSSTYGALANASVNFTIKYSNGTYFSNYTFTTDSTGAFYSESNYYSGAKNISAPLTNGTYILRAQYNDSNNNVSFSEIEVSVVNQTLDVLKIKPNKAVYNPSESMSAEVEAVRLVGDKILYVANISVNGSVVNSTKVAIQGFNCTTGNDGKCSISLTSPSSYGDYFLEIGDFKTFSSFSVIPFSYGIYVKDDTTSSLKNIFSLGEKAKVEVKINNASSSDIYTFSGYIADSAGNSIKSITSSVLNSTNSFTNSYSFTVDALTFGYGPYLVYITVSKSGDGSITSLSSFSVQDWVLSVEKKTSNSGFEYEYSAFSNKTLRFQASPSYRLNGSIIPEINFSFFTISLKDSLNNVVASANTSWNATCGKSGCYEYSLVSPLYLGKYYISTTLSHSGDSQIDTKVVNIISGAMSGQSTDKDGTLKELFGTNEYVYLSLSSYNATSTSFNLSDAEIFLVSYMNGTAFSYTKLNNFTAINSSNNISEWAWNSTLQRFKLDVPKIGGVYDVFIFGNNRTLGAETKFIVNPYDVCSSAKNTPGNVSSGYYYVYQFKTSDTVYFELKLTQANNPTGKATASNITNSSYGKGAACSIDTTTKQVVSNATISVVEVKNLETGSLQILNTTETICQASDSSGAYSCTVKPLSKWDGGINIIKFNIQGTDGSSSIYYSNFESRAFYLYGYSSNWQNNPNNNITLNVQLYEAGTNWWSSSSSGGLSGTVSIKRIEYMGRDGEWIWPPVDSGYNVSNISSASVTSGYSTISLPVSLSPSGAWKTGNYRVVLQATKTSTGETDYGYAWFAVKLWDVYGSPIECNSNGCSYKSYFNSKENISLYITINKAGNWQSYSGDQDIFGNVSVSIKKIEECRTWPCKELNSSQYTSNKINVNASSPWYSSSTNKSSNYTIQINRTSGTWNSGWYSVVLDVNGTDTGYAWFNAISFYVDTQPTNSSGAGRYTIRGSQSMFFNVTTTKSYKWNSYGGARYNISDYINTTITSAVLRTWDSQTQKSKELSSSVDFNITPTSINGTKLINLTYNNSVGKWPTGYYYGELTLNNSDGELSTGWLWFNVQPFRVSISSTSYSIDSDQCISANLTTFDADWSSSTPLYGNYSVTNVYEDVWSGSGSSRVTYTNFTSTSFNASTNATFCPNSGQWGSGNWGGYHSLNVIVKDNVVNDTQTGWLSFRTVPFQITWNPNSLGNKQTTANINTTVNLTKSTGGSATGNLTKVYQWRYDNYQSTKEEYRFVVNTTGYSCDSSVSGQCVVNGTANVTIFAPSTGWKVGYNYLQADWAKQTDASSTVQDWSGIYFEGRETYNGYFSNSDTSGNWKYYFSPTENITIKLIFRDANYAAASSITISSVSYALTQNCWTEACKSYTAATFSPTTTDSNGEAILKIKVPSGGWTKGDYSIKAVVGGVSVTGGSVRIKDLTPPNITFSVPQNNATYNISMAFSATTTKSSTCSINLVNYDNFYNWYCYGWNSTNSSSSSQTLNACNSTKYNYNGSSYKSESVSNDYHSYYDGINYSSCYTWSSSSSCYGQDTSKTKTYLTTGGTSHSYTLNLTGLPIQHYGMSVSCYDEDYNYANALASFRVNNSL